MRWCTAREEPTRGVVPALEVRNLRASCAASPVLRGVYMEVAQGQVVVLFGRAGAGKTTLLRSIAGLHGCTAGRLRVFGRDIAGLPPHLIAEGGTAYVPQGRKVFGTLTVRENLLVTASQRGAWDIKRIFDRFPALAAQRDARSCLLSFADQQILSLARSLMLNARLMLLDEPSQGLSPGAAADLFQLISELRSAGTAVLLVEQKVDAAWALAQHAYVLDHGRIVYDGPPTAIAGDRERVQAMLGIAHPLPTRGCV